jgi:CRP-like cAMP-binding protein
MCALEKLREFFLPIVLRRFSQKRLLTRMQKIKVLLLAQMTPLEVEDLLRLEVFHGWHRDSVTDALGQFTPLAFSADSVIVKEGDAEGGLIVLDSGRVRVCKRRPPDKEVLVAAMSGKKNLSDALKNCYDVISTSSSKGSSFNALSVVQGTPAFTSLRSADEGRTLVWHLDQKIYTSIKLRHSGAAFSKVVLAVTDTLRRTQMVSANAPTPQALRNCLRNAAFSFWPEKQLMLLIGLLKPFPMHPGEVIFSSSDIILGNRIVFIAAGAVDVVVVKNYNSSGSTGAAAEKSMMKSLSSTNFFKSSGGGAMNTTNTNATDNEVRAVQGPWTCFGADSIAVNERKHFHVTARSEVDVFVCDRDEYDVLTSKDPQLQLLTRRGIVEARERDMPSGVLVGSGEQVPQVREALRRNPALHMVPDSLITRLCEEAHPMWLPPNEPLLSPNLRASVVIIASGVCRGQRASLNASTQGLDADLNLRGGTVMGVMNVALNTPFPYNVASRSVVEAYSISASAFVAVLSGSGQRSGQVDFLARVQDYCSLSKGLQVITLPSAKN